MTTLLHVAQPTDSGVARCLAQLAAAQRSAGLDVRVACPPGGTLTDDLVAAGVPVLAWPATRSPGLAVAAEVRCLRAVIASVSPDVVHLHSAKAGLAGRLALQGTLPTAFQPHAWSYEAVTGPARRASVGWERVATRWTHLLVCVSEAERQLGAHHRTLPPRVAVVPNGVDLDALVSASRADRAEARARLGLADVPTAVIVGRLARQKGQDLAVAAWPLVRARLPTAQLALVGDGPDRASLQAAAGDGVHLAGASLDVASWYAAADVVLVPSRWEGMALTPLEAMARGRSVVAADVAGVRESVPPRAGQVLSDLRPSSLAAAVLARLDGRVDADAEGRAGRMHVERSHSLAATTSATTAAVLALLP